MWVKGGSQKIELRPVFVAPLETCTRDGSLNFRRDNHDRGRGLSRLVAAFPGDPCPSRNPSTVRFSVVTGPIVGDPMYSAATPYVERSRIDGRARRFLNPWEGFGAGQESGVYFAVTHGTRRRSCSPVSNSGLVRGVLAMVLVLL